MSSQAISSTPKKAAKRGKKPKSNGLSDFCRICACSFAIRLGNFSKTSYISADNFFRRCYTVWHLSTTMNMTQLFNGESSFYNMFWNFASKKFFDVFRKQACISLLQSAEAHRPLLKKRWMESLTLSSLLFVIS